MFQQGKLVLKVRSTCIQRVKIDSKTCLRFFLQYLRTTDKTRCYRNDFEKLTRSDFLDLAD